MNFTIFCLIFLASLTFEGCLATFNPSPAFDRPFLTNLEKHFLQSFQQSAEIIRSMEMIKMRKYFSEARDKSNDDTKKFLEVLSNATRDVTEELMTNLTKIEADSKAKMDQNSKDALSFFNSVISAVKNKFVRDFISEAKLINGSLEAKAASLRESIDLKFNKMNGLLRKAVEDAYESEADAYWREIRETQMAKIISEARRGVEAQVSAFMTQQFKDNLQNYEAQLKRLQQSYVDETSRKIGELETKKNLFAQELKDLAASLKLSLEAAKEQKALQSHPVHKVTEASPEVVDNTAGSGVVNNPSGHEVVHNGDGHDTNANGTGHEIDATIVNPKPSVRHDVFETGIGSSTPETVLPTSTPPIIETSTELNPSDQIHIFFDKLRNKL